jgi:cysteine desulfurase
MYTVLSVGFQKNEQTEMLLYTLDMDGICVSGGSACSSGANAGSHVIQSIYKGKANQSTIRFSFSKFNTKAEIDKVVEVLIQKIGKAVTA